MRYNAAAWGTGWRRSCLLLALLGLVLVACGPAPTQPSPTSTPPPSPTAGPAVAITRLTAQLFGTLVDRDGCVRVRPDTGGSYLLAWPPDFEVRVEGDAVHVVTAGGEQVSLHVGDAVYLSGGEVKSADYLSESVRQALPAHCEGPYWVVGAEVRLEATATP
jgi:hypothetical protein